MKQLIIALLLTFTAKAQHVKTSGTHFSSGASDKNWSNQTSESATSATFSDYSGESYITFVSEKAVRLKLNYSLGLSKGQADIVFSGKDTQDRLGALFVQADGKGVSEDDKTVYLEPGQEYQLIFRGKNAKGAFACNWNEL